MSFIYNQKLHNKSFPSIRLKKFDLISKMTFLITLTNIIPYTFKVEEDMQTTQILSEIIIIQSELLLIYICASFLNMNL